MENLKTWQKIGIGAAAVIGIIGIAGIASAEESAAWTSIEISGKLSDKISLKVAEELRFSDVTNPELARQHTDISVACSVGNVVTAVTGYRNTSAGEHRPYVGLGVSVIRGTVDVDSYTRLELRDFDTFRARTDISATLTTATFATPYVSNEVFVDDSGLTGNRASLGVSKAINSTFGVSGYYMLDTAMGDATTHSHVVGAGLSITL